MKNWRGSNLYYYDKPGRYPLNGELVTYLKYRKETGRCELCKVKMKEHIVCFDCGILLGEGHDDPIMEKGGHYFCSQDTGKKGDWHHYKGGIK